MIFLGRRPIGYAAILDYIEDDLRSPASTGTIVDDDRPSRWEAGYELHPAHTLFSLGYAPLDQPC